jgi:hypothetical protein
MSAGEKQAGQKNPPCNSLARWISLSLFII